MARELDKSKKVAKFICHTSKQIMLCLGYCFGAPMKSLERSNHMIKTKYCQVLVQHRWTVEQWASVSIAKGGKETSMIRIHVNFDYCRHMDCFGSQKQYRFDGNGLQGFVRGNRWTSKEKIASVTCHSVQLEWTNAWTISASEELSAFVALSSLSTQGMVNGRHLSYMRSRHALWRLV